MSGRRRWLHLPGHTVRVRLTALYGALFFASGAGLLAITFALVAGGRLTVAFQVSGAAGGTVRLAPANAKLPVQAVPPGLSPGAASALRKLFEQVTKAARAVPSGAGGLVGSSSSSSSGVSVAGPPVIFSRGPRPSSAEFLGFQATLPTPGELHRLIIVCGIALAIMTFVSIGLGWVVAGRALSPIRLMALNARQISAENLHERLGVQGPPDELKDLGDTIDDLLARLETAFEAQKRFVANASHELRTPLTMMRTSVDVAVGKPQPPEDVRVLAGKVGEGLDEADRLLEGLLLLARAQRGAMGDIAAVSLPDLVSSSVAAEQEELTRKRITVENEMIPATVMGNETLVALMVANVINNAVRHNVEGGTVHVSNDFDGVLARLMVENGGEILDESQVQLLGEPFYRIGAERLSSGHGAGLGLSIVSAIAAAHGGILRLTARPEGGLRVVIELPLAPRV